MTPENQDASGCRFVVAVGESGGSAAAVHAGARLAQACSCPWHAVHVETPEAHRRGSRQRAAEALALAAKLGATVAVIPAASVADGLISQVEEQRATDLLLQRPSGRRSIFRGTLANRISHDCPNVTIHLLARGQGSPRLPAEHVPKTSGIGFRSYLYALALVAITTLIAAPLGYAFGNRGLDLFFLFPVITAAVRFGLRPGLLAAVASVACHNLLFVRPIFVFTMGSQSLFMVLGLSAVAIYTGVISERLRGRVRLSDRSATENAAIVTFAQELARAGSWDETAAIVCQAVSTMLDVRTVLLREKDGALILVASNPPGASFGPVDEIARDWAWQNGEETGRGTARMAAADWQFLPLKTGLGMLALIGIARDNGTEPVPADRAVLLATLISLAALAHERLRLEDIAIARAKSRTSGTSKSRTASR